MLNAVAWARTITYISEEELKVNKAHCSKSFLFSNVGSRGKKEDFDVGGGMGVPDSAKVWKLTGLFLLFLLGQLIPKKKKQLALYSDDGLAAVVKLPCVRISRGRDRE